MKDDPLERGNDPLGTQDFPLVYSSEAAHAWADGVSRSQSVFWLHKPVFVVLLELEIPRVTTTASGLASSWPVPGNQLEVNRRGYTWSHCQ